MNRYGVTTKEEFTQAYIEETRGQLRTLIDWVSKHPNATFEYCEKQFPRSITNKECDETGRDYWFDMYYGNTCVTLERKGVKDRLHILGDIELYNDDLSGGNGEFEYDEEVVEDTLKREFNIGFYSVA